MLPAWVEHESHSKLTRLDEQTLVPPHSFLRQYLNASAAQLGRAPADIRVLDVGCGRGDTVAWLCREGWDAYGVDVADTYIAYGSPYLRELGLDADRLRFASDATYPFDAASFDIVVSDQVFEHVGDLRLLARELARISRPGAHGLHVFPARWRPVEVHLKAPFVHWLPKGRIRRGALHALLAAHLAAPYFSEHSIQERADIYATFSDTETFYRPISEIRRVMEHAGFACYFAAARDKVHHEAPGIPHFALPPLGFLYQNFFSVCLATTREG